MPLKNKNRRLYIPPPASHGPLPFSNAVLAGDTLYLSGHMGLDPATKKIPPDVEQEARRMLDAFSSTLSLAKMSFDDLVYVTVFCSDVSLFEKFNSVYRSYFGELFPARAFIGSGPLLFGAHFEIQGIAVKRTNRLGMVKRRKRPVR